MQYVYPETNLLGKPTHEIDLEFNRKKYFLKDYADAMVRIKSMKRVYKA